MPDHFSVAVDEDGSTSRLALSGEIDTATVATVAVHIEQILAGNPAQILLDLSATRFLDSAGIGAIVLLANAAVDRRLGLRLVPGPANVMRVLDMVGLTEVFERTESGTDKQTATPGREDTA